KQIYRWRIASPPLKPCSAVPPTAWRPSAGSTTQPFLGPARSSNACLLLGASRWGSISGARFWLTGRLPTSGSTQLWPGLPTQPLGPTEGLYVLRGQWTRAVEADGTVGRPCHRAGVDFPTRGNYLYGILKRSEWAQDKDCTAGPRSVA